MVYQENLWYHHFAGDIHLTRLLTLSFVLGTDFLIITNCIHLIVAVNRILLFEFPFKALLMWIACGWWSNSLAKYFIFRMLAIIWKEAHRYWMYFFNKELRTDIKWFSRLSNKPEQTWARDILINLNRFGGIYIEPRAMSSCFMFWCSAGFIVCSVRCLLKCFSSYMYMLFEVRPKSFSIQMIKKNWRK